MTAKRTKYVNVGYACPAPGNADIRIKQLRREGRRASMPIKIKSIREAKIAEWSDEKGFGFVQVGSGRVFLHRREFAERHKRPAVGI